MKILIAALLSFLSLKSVGQAYGTFLYNGTAPIPNQLPIANAGVDQAIQLPTNSVTLTGSGIDYDGTITAYLWTKVFGGAATITSPTSASTTVTGLSSGIYVFRLRVTDNSGDTAINDITVTVNSATNIPPVANAGADKTRTLPADTATVFGSGTDADGTIVNYSWVKTVSSPTATILGANTATLSLSNLVWGTYTFQLTVTDNSGAVGVDTMVIVVSPAVTPPSANGGFSFTVANNNTNVSVGVFRKNGQLVKNFIYDSLFQAGTYYRSWDGKDNNGNLISVNTRDTAYDIIVQTNQINATWQGAKPGNTSDSVTGVTKHRGVYHCMQALAFVGQYGHFSTGYGEGQAVINKFDTATPNQKIIGSISGDVNYVTTDGTYLYWATIYSNAPNFTYVFATNPTTGAQINFSSGIVSPVDNHKTSVISFVNQMNSAITGIGVQKTGSYLFVSRGALNQVQVLNKTTGALVQTITLTNPQGIACDNSNNVWIINNNTAQKFSVGAGGNLTATLLTLTGTVAPMSVSVNSNEVAVADGGASQQVKFYNNTTGAATSTLGIAGGYASEASVSNTRFYFSDINGQGIGQYLKTPFIAYEPNGSFWVGDPGNFRVQKFDASKSYVTTIMSMPSLYSVFVDRNDSTKMFAEGLEFQMDYSTQNFNGNNGWIFKKNWNYGISNALYNGIPRFQTTLSNGRTYGFIRRGNNWEVLEYPATGQMRFTGIQTNGLTQILCQDGSLQDYTTVGDIATLKRYPLTGFSSNNPVWSGTAQVLSVATKDDAYGSPITFPNSQNWANGVVAWYNPSGKASINYTDVPFYGPHLQIMQSGVSTPKVITEKSTLVRYIGVYPTEGFFDVGNSVNNYAGGSVAVTDNLILTSYHGEFWKNSQTNKFNIYSILGLPVLQFGITGQYINGRPALAEMAGNVVTPVLVKSGADYYLYHGDESHHAAVHRWKITGMGTLSYQYINMPFPSAYTPPVLNYTDLLAGLPFDATVVNNIAGWIRYPATDNLTNPYNNYYRVFTSLQSYDSLSTNDVQVDAVIPNAQTDSTMRDLGTNNVTTNWKVTGNLIYPQGSNVGGGGNNQYLEFLDNANRVITRVFLSGSFVAAKDTLYANTTIITHAATGVISQYLSQPTPFEIGVVSGVISVQIGNYTVVNPAIVNPLADWRKPKYISIKTTGTNNNPQPKGQSTSLQKLRYYGDY